MRFEENTKLVELVHTWETLNSCEKALKEIGGLSELAAPLTERRHAIAREIDAAMIHRE